MADTIPQTVLFPDLFDRPLVATFDQPQASSDGGAVLLKLRDVEGAELDLAPLLAGGIAAMVVGYGALTALVYLVKVGKLDRFSYYMWAVALVAGGIAWFA